MCKRGRKFQGTAAFLERMRKKVVPGICSLLALLCCFTTALSWQSARGEALFLIWDERGKYGFIDASGRVRIPAKFDGALPFTEGLAAVSLGGKWGFIDSAGRIAIPMTYYAVSPFSDGVAAVTLASVAPQPRQCGYIDRSGLFVIKPQTRFSCKDFKEGFAIVGLYHETYGEPFDGYMNKEGELVLGGQYVRADPFSEGLARIVDFEKTVFINGLGEIVIYLGNYRGAGQQGDEYEPAGSFSEGLALVGIKIMTRYGYSRYGFINKKGRVVFELPEEVRVMGAFSGGRALVIREKTEKVKVDMGGGGEVITMEVQTSPYGYVDKRGREAVPARFSQAENFSEALAAVKTGKPQPSHLRDIRGSAAESYGDDDEEGNWVCINPAGQVVIKKCGEPLSHEELTQRFPQFGEGFGKGFRSGLFFSKVYLRDRRAGEGRKAVYGYMNRRGKYVWIQPYGKDAVPPRWWRENYPQGN